MGRPRKNLATREEALAPIEKWTSGRKLRLCLAIRKGLISAAEASRAHGLSDEELIGWLDAVARRDFEALRARPRRVA